MGLTTFASVISDMPAMTEVNLSMNKCFDMGSAKALADVIPKSKLQTLVIGKEAKNCSVPVAASDVMTLDFSNQDLGPGELMLISSVVIPVSTAMTEIRLDGNPITGSRYNEK